ncbi:MAG TPA: hypothetical protein VHH52_06870 [Pseudonocardiaceae bacterium]|nr:hypothetical protein [Pseudonocardiaceae bacterium]
MTAAVRDPLREHPLYMWPDTGSLQLGPMGLREHGAVAELVSELATLLTRLNSGQLADPSSALNGAEQLARLVYRLTTHSPHLADLIVDLRPRDELVIPRPEWLG